MNGQSIEGDGRFFDRDANGGAGAEVSGRVATAIQFRLTESEQCIARGVMLMEDGTLYTFTVRKPGRGDVITRRDGQEVCRIATRMHHGTFAGLACGLLEFEREYLDADLFAFYSKQVDAL